jgi:CheY-specific phosphatase CheX
MANTKKTHDLLMNAIFEVFEKMFFVFLEPLDEDVKYDMVASINFTGPIKGEFHVFFTRGVAEAMVQNMLGVDADGVTDKLIEDCAKEAVNMISGNFLQKYDSSKVFDLSIPLFENKSGVFRQQEEASSENTWNLSFESEESLLGVKMSIL